MISFIGSAASYIPTVLTWAPTAMYGLRVLSSLVSPTLIRVLNPPTVLAKDLFPHVFNKVDNLRKDILIYRGDIENAKAVGANLGLDALFFFNGSLAQIDPEAFRWICTHEIAHIYSSDDFKASSFACVSSTLSTRAIPYLQSFLPTWLGWIANGVPYLLGSNVFAGMS